MQRLIAQLGVNSSGGEIGENFVLFSGKVLTKVCPKKMQRVPQDFISRLNLNN